MRRVLTWLLGLLALAGVAVLLVWAFIEGRAEVDIGVLLGDLQSERGLGGSVFGEHPPYVQPVEETGPLERGR